MYLMYEIALPGQSFTNRYPVPKLKGEPNPRDASSQRKRASVRCQCERCREIQARLQGNDQSLPQDRHVGAAAAAMTQRQPEHAGDVTTESMPIDCATLVAALDAPPVRSPQSVHSVLAGLFRGRAIVEIGTRNGDGIKCFARFAREAVAIEMDRAYCQRLEQRKPKLAGEGGYRVVCSPYEQAMTEFGRAEYITWWMSSRDNVRILTTLQSMQAHGFLRANAEAVMLFDLNLGGDAASWRELQPRAAWSTRVAFNECEACLARYPRDSWDFWLNCARAAGTFVVARFRVSELGSDLASAPSWTDVWRDREPPNVFLDFESSPCGRTNGTNVTTTPTASETVDRQLAISQTGLLSTWHWESTVSDVVQPTVRDGWQVDYFVLLQLPARQQSARWTEQLGAKPTQEFRDLQAGPPFEHERRLFNETLRQAGAAVRVLQLVEALEAADWQRFAVSFPGQPQNLVRELWLVSRCMHEVHHACHHMHLSLNSACLPAPPAPPPPLTSPATDLPPTLPLSRPCRLRSCSHLAPMTSSFASVRTPAGTRHCASRLPLRGTTAVTRFT